MVDIAIQGLVQSEHSVAMENLHFSMILNRRRQGKEIVGKGCGELSGDEFSQEQCSSDDRGDVGLESSCVEFSDFDSARADFADALESCTSIGVVTSVAFARKRSADQFRLIQSRRPS